ncbi:MAG TPA: metallopeptidase TldD-related protein, partial [Bryobacteraceae bacterium]|nr:metallopeptidase TldD-related protein [Bryobacteraceae bacterium]
EVLSSSVSFDASQSIHYIHNTEGTTLRVPETLHYVTLRAAAQAPDGMSVRDYTMLAARASSDLPPEAEQSKAITALAENVKSLAAAPLAESYSGPVLFEGVAASQVLADVFGAQLSVPRRPVSDSSRNLPFQPSELEGRIGSRVLPEDFDLVDDPSLTNWKGRPLLGSYAVDEEGVVPKPLNVVEKGKLQHMLLTRQPVRGFEGSNGRARVPGPYGARAATFSNLILKTSAPTKDTDLKKKLLDIIGKRNKPYGMIVRKLDFPSTASMEEFRQMAASSGGGRPASAPILVYRVYPDGREELVRGLRFRGLNVRSFRDILAAGSESHVFHLLNNLAPMSLVGAGSYVAPQSVIAPSLIFEDVELDRPQENMPKVPVVPPPALVSSR